MALQIANQLGHPECRRPLLPWPRRPGTDDPNGASWWPKAPASSAPANGETSPSGPGADAGGALLQPSWRRRATFSTRGCAHMTDAHMTGLCSRIDSLHVSFATRRRLVEAVRASLSVAPGSYAGCVSSAGSSGKSVTAFAVTRLLEPSARVPRGRIQFRGRTSPGPARHRRDRRPCVAPPSHGVPEPARRASARSRHGPAGDGRARRHQSLSGRGAQARALELLQAVLVTIPTNAFDAYPDGLSGGMCQRAMIAMAIASNFQLC